MVTIWASRTKEVQLTVYQKLQKLGEGRNGTGCFAGYLNEASKALFDQG